MCRPRTELQEVGYHVRKSCVGPGVTRIPDYSRARDVNPVETGEGGSARGETAERRVGVGQQLDRGVRGAKVRIGQAAAGVGEEEDPRLVRGDLDVVENVCRARDEENLTPLTRCL